MSISSRDSECDPIVLPGHTSSRIAYCARWTQPHHPVAPIGDPADTRAQPLHPVAYLWGSDPAHPVGIHVAQRDGYVAFELRRIRYLSGQAADMLTPVNIHSHFVPTVLFLLAIPVSGS